METAENQEMVTRLLESPPLLHDWFGEQRVGGLGGDEGRRFVKILDRRSPSDSFDVLETGAGLSTLLFLALGATSVTSIDSKADVGDRIYEEAASRGLDTSRISFVCDRSELELPRLASSGRQFDVCLIDGSHAWPTVFVDFCYANMCLRSHGLVVLDDVQLYSVKQLFLLLKSQPEFRQVSNQWDWKLGAFIKETEDKFLPDFIKQQFLITNSGGA